MRLRARGWIGSVLMIAMPAAAGTIGVSWQASPGASGYKVYWGPSAGQPSGSRDVGNVTTTTLTGLQDCASTYIAVSAYNAYGESPKTGEVTTLPRPAVSAATPNSALQGSQVVVTLAGANFETGAAVSTDNPY